MPGIGLFCFERTGCPEQTRCRRGSREAAAHTHTHADASPRLFAYALQQRCVTERARLSNALIPHLPLHVMAPILLLLILSTLATGRRRRREKRVIVFFPRPLDDDKRATRGLCVRRPEGGSFTASWSPGTHTAHAQCMYTYCDNTRTGGAHACMAVPPAGASSRLRHLSRRIFLVFVLDRQPCGAACFGERARGSLNFVLSVIVLFLDDVLAPNATGFSFVPA